MTSAATAFASYAQSSAATASPFDVIRMAYERILTACDRAVLAENNRPSGWVEQFHDEMVRAQTILLELTAGLTMSHADERVVALSHQLESLYRYANSQLMQANTTKSTEPLHAVRLVIDGLRDAWVTSAR